MIGKIPLSRLTLWNVDGGARVLAEKVPCSPLTALLLKMKGISEDDPAEARAMLSPGLDDSLDRLDLGNSSRKAADLWRDLEGAERVVIYGDYDADGACATSLAMEMALAAFREVRYFIPHRHREGYGVHESVVKSIARGGCDLLVAVDCGTRDINALKAARDHGIPVIVFDHHAPGDSLPEGSVVVNPLVDGSSEARALCAAGVLWAWAMKERVFPGRWLEERVDLAALATLADHVPLGNLNRAIVLKGLQKIRSSARPGLGSLISAIGGDAAAVDEEFLVMKVIPCLNAAGRLGLADISVDVLLGGENLERKVMELVRLNRKRQSLSGEILEETLPKVRDGASLVLSDFSWPVGVLSGVASRLCADTGLPVALASLSGDHVRGTLRVPQGVDAMDILEKISPHLLSWGGHRFAAGFSVSRESWVKVRALMEDILVSARPEPGMVQAIDHPPELLDLEEVFSMSSLGPFGAGNPYPLFFAHGGSDVGISPLGRDGKHVRVNYRGREFLAFGGYSLSDCIRNSPGWTYRARINNWQGRSRVDLIIESIAVEGDNGREGCFF